VGISYFLLLCLLFWAVLRVNQNKPNGMYSALTCATWVPLASAAGYAHVVCVLSLF
jgi:hypothetical protein